MTGFQAPDTGKKKFNRRTVFPTLCKIKSRRWLRKRLATGFEHYRSHKNRSSVMRDCLEPLIIVAKPLTRACGWISPWPHSIAITGARVFLACRQAAADENSGCRRE